ncbi:SDR family NAD(P)-dependent oxidoreductase [Bosea sp. BIWAKO-01]|uniref:SDR family NAD(P)-dependent oxidoreductase n=1 Tax=Bosea sp. BIWAKO-01 TaxID=506668 RepID=UPI001FCDD1D8|nr:SDR family oxidoreductase [Bosea sp. BIWAKO-01]
MTVRNSALHTAGAAHERTNAAHVRCPAPDPAANQIKRPWALELGRHGITSNSIGPGPIRTELFERANPPGSPATQAILDAVPVGRMGEPDDVAFLLDARSGFVTGQTLYVCGGMTAARPEAECQWISGLARQRAPSSGRTNVSIPADARCLLVAHFPRTTDGRLWPIADSGNVRFRPAWRRRDCPSQQTKGRHAPAHQWCPPYTWPDLARRYRP